MNDLPDPPPSGEGEPKDPAGKADGGGSGGGASSSGDQSDKPVVERYAHQPVSARVPERVARGVFSTGQVILDSPKEFVIDFLQGLTRPQQVVARIVLTPATMVEFASALRQNVDNYARQFGPPTALPPPGPNRPTIQEIYENFRLSDEMMSGVYANAVLIGHSVTEFFLDFITTFYPTSAVSARIFLPAPQAPRFLTSVEASLQNYQKRYQS